MEDKKILLDNIDKIHTTEMGVDRIRRNLKIDTADVVEYCINKVLDNVFGKIKILQKAPCEQNMNGALLCVSYASILLSITIAGKWNNVNNARQRRRSPCCLHYSILSAMIQARGVGR